ncbi:MAG: hypothetical protein B6D61_11975, partial [Bacteroidetes bacterium 4484_249]
MKNLFTILIAGIFIFAGYSTSNAQPANDNFANAEVIPHSPNWESIAADYTTAFATADLNAASCWNTGPSFNVWFTFQAVYPEMILTVDRGDTQGTIRRVNVAAWESDGITEIACNRYVDDEDDVTLVISNLTSGNWYYISVDNLGAGHRGTFTLTQRHYDDYAGAQEIPHLDGWCSPGAAFSNVNATPDLNAGSCWNTSPDRNVWFKFLATSTSVQLLVDRGGSQGTIRQINVAIWESDGTTE